jgi:phenylalanyl-tRNA synthetase beta chain
MKISYNWLKWYVSEIPEPNQLEKIFTYHLCEVESVEKLPDGDHIFDLGILPNRAHDLLSHHGVARELCGLLGSTFNDPTPMYKTPVSSTTKLKVEIKSKNCRRYSARIVRNIKIGPSPEWVVKHLESIGQRSINNVVDATNIVMYDAGQPTHAFDLKKITDETINIENAKDGDELKLVGREGIVAKLKETDIMITSGGKNLALGGVKGGFDSGINDTTTDIVIEVANFDPTAVRKTARRIGQLSDSAKRFENDLSPTLCDLGMVELSALLLEMFPDASFEDVVDIYPTRQEERKVSFSQSYISKILGVEISEKEIEKILLNYKFEYKKDGDTYTVGIPDLRLDLVNKEDFAEEIGRVYGYDKVKPELPKTNFNAKKNEQYEKISQIRDTLTRSRYKEVMTYAFTQKGEIEVLASASDKNFLRTNMTDGLKQSYELNKLNAPLLRIDEIKIFEIGTVFKKDKEEIHVAWNEKDKINEMTLDEFISSSHHQNFVALPASGLRHEQNFDDVISNDFNYFKMWSLYPFIVRDIAVWVPEGTEAEKLRDIYKEFGTELLQGEPKLVDKFAKDGKISYAFRLIFQSYDRTLTVEEVNQIIAKITEKLSSSGFVVR